MQQRDTNLVVPTVVRLPANVESCDKDIEIGVIRPLWAQLHIAGNGKATE